MAKRKNNFGKVLLAIALIGVTAGVASYYMNDYIESQKMSFTDEQLVSTLQENNNIELTVRKSSIDSEFGSQTIKYNITPLSANDEVLISINYVDGTEVEKDILLIDHDQKNKEIVISCNKVFTKQIELTFLADFLFIGHLPLSFSNIYVNALRRDFTAGT